MPRPIALASGVWRLNVRLPADLADKLRGGRVALPFDGVVHTVVATDKVSLSLRTKDAAVAKVRFAEAYAALIRHFENVRQGPRPLTHKAAVALAGEAYRMRVGRFEHDPTLTPDAMEAERAQIDIDVAAWANGPETVTSEDGGEAMLLPIPIERARLLAALQRPSGPQLLAWETWADVGSDYARVTLADALEHLFGPEADAICAVKGILIDDAGRVLLLEEIGKAVHDSANKLARNIEGDYAPDPAAARFPAFDATPTAGQANAAAARGAETVVALFERWKAKQGCKMAPATVRRYEPSLASLGSFTKGRDWRSITAADVFAWANHRHEVDLVAAGTVNRNDLVAVSSVLGWATMANGRRMSAGNPSFGIKIETGKKQVLREQMFRADEVSAILTLARSVEPDRRYPRATASRRWCPWLCAYSGARVQEPLWLKKSDVRRERGVDVLCLPKTKDGVARMVPIHRALIAEGFLDFVRSAPDGYLFVGDRPQGEGASRTMQELRAAELSSWIRAKVKLEKGVSPSHGWRHTWVTIAEGAGIPPRLSNRITGHNMRDVSGRYVGSLITMLAAEMDKFPEYVI